MSLLLPASFSESRCQRIGIWALLAITLLLYLPGTSSMPMMDRDEPRFAHATVEMMQRGTWTVPYFNDEYRFDKPPLTYWWMRLHYHLLGINELAARLHSVTATWLVAVCIFGIARRLGDARHGLAAGLAWLITLQVLVHGRLCVADMPMVLCVTLAMRAVLELLIGAEHHAFSRWHWLLYGSLGLGFLAKGPIALLVPAVAVLLWRFAFWRQAFDWRRLHPIKGLLFTLAIVAAWGIPALIQTQGLFWKVGMGEHVVERGARAFNGRFPVPGYYFVTALASLFPWIALLPQIATAVRRQWSQQLALLTAWLAAPYLIFTFYATQLAHYVMPGFPAAMVLLAVADAVHSPPRWQRWWSAFCLLLMVVVGVAVSVLSLHPELPAQLSMLLLHGALLVILLTWLGFLIVLRYHDWRDIRPMWMALVLLLLPVPLTLIGKDMREMHPAAQLSQKLGPLPADAELTAWEFTEPSLVFHFDHPWRFTAKLETVKKQLSKAKPSVTVLLRREWTLSNAIRSKTPARDLSREVDALLASCPDHTITHFTGFNAARSSWVELVVLSRP